MYSSNEITREILFNFNNTSCKYPSHKTIHELFEEQVDRTAGNIALVHGNRRISYMELDEKSNRIAHYLLNECNCENEDIIVVLQEQSINMIASILGVLKAGFAFLAVDPKLPFERQKHMLDEALSPVIISDRSHICLLNKLQWECKSVKYFVCLDSADVYREIEEMINPLMDKKLWDYVGEYSEDPIGRGGWKSSYTGELLLREEVLECSSNVLVKLKPYINNKTRILEIGCSSGITMFNIAPFAGFYCGTDMSDIILEETRRQADKEGHSNIVLKALAAHEIDRLDEKDFDIIIFNSVVQAFHGHNYFRQVLIKAVKLLKDTGVIFVGDIMDQDLKNDLISSLITFEKQHLNSGYKTKTDFSNELFLNRAFFNDLLVDHKEFKTCTFSDKIHTIRNELTEYRYDAIMEVDKSNIQTKKGEKVKYQHGIPEIEKQPGSRPTNKAGIGNLAYVIFTSGSTGRPKGVLVEHRALVNMACWYNTFHHITPEDRSAKFANCGFDASIMELFPALIKGASIYILDPETKSDLNKLNQYFEDNGITVCFLPTQYCEQFMEFENKTLRIVNTGGEKLKKYIKRSYSLVDNYGLAECTVVSTCFLVDRQYANIPIGKPIFNNRIYILDKYKHLLPPGEAGELYIAGDGLARGYLNNPVLTEERFTDDPFFEGQRMYRTGDVARWLLDGNLEFLGRTDDQVKIRGYRIEPGEIERILTEHVNIKECVVSVITDPNQDNTLCAHLVVSRTISENEIKDYLATKVPSYMVPGHFYFLESMPLTSNGKIDKKALPHPNTAVNNSREYKAPENETESKLVKIWEEVLGVSDVGVLDDFFDLGGHSLKVLKAAVQINREFGIELSAAELFKARTIKEQGKIINAYKYNKQRSVATDEEKELILKSFNRTKNYPGQEMPVHKVFEEAVQRNSEKIALVFNNKRMSYGELNRRSNQIASFLRKNGVNRESIVTLVANRSFEMITGLLGILKAGAACLPLSPQYPQKYIDSILNDSGSKFILKHICHDEHELYFDHEKYLVMDIDNTMVQSESGENPGIINEASDMLYIIYTSGTSGKPKGVIIEHRNFMNLIRFQQYDTCIDFGCVLQFASITFDVSFQEIFSCLLSGGKLVLISEQVRTDISQLFDQIQKEKVGTLFLSPSLLHLIFGEKEYVKEFPPSVKHIVCAGEQLFVPQNLREFLSSNGIYLHNHYGPSETHVVTALEMAPVGQIPEKPSIGMPVTNRTIYILGKDNELLPPGIPGELCIGGKNIGRGYLNNEGLTLEKFTPDPFQPGQSIYHSGDLAQWLPDGTIEFLGRMDDQIKVRGYRIEPSVIENQLIRFAGVKKALVLPYEEKTNKFLCAYIIADADLKPHDLRQYLLKHLPDYMVPSFFVFVSRFPLNINGKIDRKALPSPTEYKFQLTKHNTPLSGMEKRVAEIWQDVLCVPEIDIHDDFFELGGHSLKVLKLVVQINREFNTGITAAGLFKARTLKEQCELIEKSEKKKYLPITSSERKEYYPASSAQIRLFAIQQMELENTAYNIPYVFSVKGNIDMDKLNAAFEKVIARHEILRTDFHLIQGAVVQRVKDTLNAGIEYVELAGKDPDKLVREFVKPFDLNNAPLFRIRLAKVKQAEYLLLIDIHHIVMDGSSLEMLWNEISLSYNGHLLTQSEIQYRNFAKWQLSETFQEKIKVQSEYWLKQFSGEIPVLNFPTDYERPEFQSFEGDIFNFSLDACITDMLKDLCKKYEVSMNMLLLAVFHILLAKYSNQEDIITGTPVYGRSHADFTSAIGMFVNTLALRSKPEGSKSFIDYLVEIRCIVLDALDNQDYPFEELVEKVNINRDVSRNPIFDTMFVMQSFADDNLKLNGLSVNRLWNCLPKSKFDMTWFAAENNRFLNIDIEYCTDLFKRDSIIMISRHYKELISRIIKNPASAISELEIATEKKMIKSNFAAAKKYTDRESVNINQGRNRTTMSNTEKQLALIWEEVLEIGNIGVDDDFFELGGQSLKAIMLMKRIKKSFKKDLNGSLIFKYSTIRELSMFLENNSNTGFSHLVKISRDSGRSNIFCVHPAPGTVICFYDLAKYFDDDRTIYALQAKGLEKGQSPHNTLEEMAADYIRSIREIQPGGPYVLIGWSIGGRIAYEMARQLEEQGDKVDLLMMLDTDTEFIFKNNTRPSSLPFFIYGVFAMFSHSRVIYKNLNITSFGINNLYRRLKLWVALIKTARKYIPAKYNGNGKVVLLQTKEGLKHERKLKDRSRNIRNFINDLEIVPIQGRHLEILSEPYIEGVCNILKRYLLE